MITLNLDISQLTPNDNESLDPTDVTVSFDVQTKKTKKTTWQQIATLVMSLLKINNKGAVNGVITLTPDDFSDAASNNKFVSQGEKNKIGAIKTDGDGTRFLNDKGVYVANSTLQNDNTSVLYYDAVANAYPAKIAGVSFEILIGPVTPFGNGRTSNDKFYWLRTLTGVTATAASGVSTTGFTANWGAVTGATGYFLTVYKGSTPVTGYNGLSVGNVTSYAVTGLATGTTYSYSLKATDGDNAGPVGNVISVITTANVSPLYNAPILAEMQLRAVSGPFKAAGDAYTNSRGCWTEIVADKNTFMSGSSSPRWTGPIPASGVPVLNLGDFTEGSDVPYKQRAINMQRAALYGAVMNDATVKAAVKAEILGQIREPKFNFKRTAGWAGAALNSVSDNGLWAFNAFVSDGDQGLFVLAEFVTNLVFSYYLNIDTWSNTEKVEFAAWCDQYAEYTYLDRRAYDSVHSNRLSVFNNDGDIASYTYVGGVENDTDHLNVISNSAGTAQNFYNWKANRWIGNRRFTINLSSGLCALVSDNAKIIKYTKYCVAEGIAFYWSAGGNFTEHNRATTWSSKGLGYVLSFIYLAGYFGLLLSKIKNDDFVWTYTTRAQCGGTQMPNPNVTNGVTLGTVDKSFFGLLDSYGKYLDGTYHFYKQGGTLGNINSLIDGINHSASPLEYIQGDTNIHIIAYMAAVKVGHPLANRLKQLANRTAPGIYPYPPSNQVQPAGVLSGTRAYTAIMSDVHFMYSGLESKGITIFS